MGWMKGLKPNEGRQEPRFMFMCMCVEWKYYSTLMSSFLCFYDHVWQLAGFQHLPQGDEYLPQGDEQTSFVKKKQCVWVLARCMMSCYCESFELEILFLVQHCNQGTFLSSEANIFFKVLLSLSKDCFTSTWHIFIILTYSMPHSYACCIVKFNCMSLA